MPLLGLIWLTAPFLMHLRSSRWSRWSWVLRGCKSLPESAGIWNVLVRLYDAFLEPRPLRSCAYTIYVAGWMINHHLHSRCVWPRATPRCLQYNNSANPLVLLEKIPSSTRQKREEKILDPLWTVTESQRLQDPSYILASQPNHHQGVIFLGPQISKPVLCVPPRAETSHGSASTRSPAGPRRNMCVLAA